MYYGDVTFELWIPGVLRGAGLTVVEVPGWQTRTTGGSFEPEGVVVHETRGSVNSSDAGEINVMINGREGLAGPIAHLYLSRTGTWHVVTAGKSNHVKTGWGGPFKGLGNSRLLGIEAQHATGEPWTPVQYQSYVRGVAAILAYTGWTVAGHFEHQPGDKTDPAFNMDDFRNQVNEVNDMSWEEKPAGGNNYTYGQLALGTNVAIYKAVGLLETLVAKLGTVNPVGGISEERLREIVREEIGKTRLS